MIALLALACSTARADEVRLSREHFLALQPEAEPEARIPGPAVQSRTLALRVGAEGVRFTATWQLLAPRPGWIDLALAGPGVRFDSVRVGTTDLPLAAGGDGVHVTLRVDRDSEVVATGTIVGDVARGMVLPLLPAPGVVTVSGPAALEGAVKVGDGRYWTSGGSVRLVPPPPDASPPSQLVLGEAGVGLTVGEGELRARARLRWRVTRGRIDRVAFTVPGAGPDLVVTGPQVGAVKRSGDRVEVELTRPEAALVALEARWTQPLPSSEEARVAIPVPRLEGAFRTSTALQVARDGQVEVVPEPTGLEGAASQDLPAWAAGLVEGTPTAAYTGDAGAGGALALYRFEPAEAPPTLVDVAQYTVATTEEGRMLVRGHLTVRNDRGAHLRVLPPDGLRLVGVRVAGETAEVARDGAATLVPLAKSVETVEGLLTFPVELVLLGEREAWERVARGAVPLPAVDVEVAVTRAVVHLPPGYRSRLKPGEDGVVAQFTEGQGITYGFAVGDVRAAQADVLFQSAVSSWMGNEFDEAQALLDELKALGGDNDDVVRLQGNLDLVLEGEEGKGDVALERRVKEQARARAQEELVEQQKLLDDAERSYSSGEYAAAEEQYEKALEIGEKLGKLSNSEDLDTETRNAEVALRLDKAKEKKAEKAPEREEAVVVTKDFLEKIPAGRSYQSAVTTVPGDASGGNENTYKTDEPVPLSVTATSLSVVVPAIGEPVRYQRLLVPAGAPVEVPVRARRTRRNP